MKISNTDVVDTKYAVVCFMDILGYSELVQNEKNKEKIYKILKNCLRNLEGNQDLIKQMRICLKKQMLGDALLFTLDIKKIPKSLKEFPSISNVEQVFVSYFIRIICRTFLEIIAETKYFLRGGIAFGQYYQSYLDDEGNKYIFSKALAKAHELEKKAAVPRIVLSNRLYRYIIQKRRNTSLQSIEILKSINGLPCLNPYFVLPHKKTEDTKKLLKKIIKAIKYQINIARGENSNVIEKYRWFVDYHNRAIAQRGLNGEFHISIPI